MLNLHAMQVHRHFNFRDGIRSIEHSTPVLHVQDLDREDIRRLYEPHCAPIAERLRVIRELRAAGIETYATLAPLLPCNPEALIDMAIAATAQDLICDPFHVRAVKTSGATTREGALRISARRGFSQWHDPEFQAEMVARLRARAHVRGRRLVAGVAGFRMLAERPA